ncbi:MAG TPA: ABC transporter permease [Anaerolineae bacterium]|nr:ABC transporter permease [Anaerolineae bacterium]
MSPDSAATPLKSTAPGFTPVAWLRVLAGPLIGIAVGLLIGAVLIRLAGAEVGTAYTAMLRGAFGGQRQLTETALKAAPLLLVGLGLTVAFRARVWNIGGEGQYFMGALFGSVAALTLSTWPAVLLIPIMLLLGAIGGALWALVAGLLKVKQGMNVIISTLMLNYIAILLVQYLSRGPLQDPNGFLPETAQFVAAARLPTLFDSRIHLGVVLALLLAPLVYLLLWRTPLGFRLRAVGSRESVARYAGIKVEWSILFVLAFSGALAGLAGLIEVSTLYTRLKGEISGGYGFTGILVALLGRMHPLGVVLAALFFAALTIGAQSMHIVSGIPHALADAIQAVIVLSVLAVDALVQRSQR